MEKLQGPFLVGATFLLLFWTGTARAQEYQVDPARENRVSFLSDAPLEDFTGVTTRVDGFVFLPERNRGAGDGLARSEFHFEVDLGSLDTGIGLRNRHMRENYLDTPRFPFAVFSGRILDLRETEDGRVAVVAGGGLEVHGVTRDREIQCQATTQASPGERDGASPARGPLAGAMRMRVSCSFQVALSDHEIPIPKLMFMKIDEVMEVEVDLHLVMIPETGALSGGSSHEW